jgi:pimeloyl-ACP methyl ester carboxylesterase
MRRSASGLLLLFLLTVPPAAPAASTSNLERERNWAEQIGDFLVAGEAVRLEARGVQFLALYTPPTESKNARRAVILLHGRGVHPAWGFIDTLRVDLAEDGWHTLSLQLPILDQDVRLAEYAKTFPEAFERIQAGIRFLQQKGIRDIVLIGHSSGAMTAAAFAAEHAQPAVKGLAVIGYTSEPAASRYMQPELMLQKIRIPVLDIFGSEDLPLVLNTVNARAEAAKKTGNAAYLQTRVKGANHFFTDRYPDLRARLKDWLDKTTAR